MPPQDEALEQDTLQEQGPDVTPAVAEDGREAPRDALVNINFRIAQEEYERCAKLARLAAAWGITERPSMAALCRLGLNLAFGYIQQVYLLKKRGQG